MAIKKTGASSEVLTVELAREWAALIPMPGERELKPGRTTFLLNHLREGTFLGTDWAKGYCKQDERWHRLDGQHTSHLLTALPSDVPFPEGLLAVIETFEFDSMEEDGAVLFDLFNNPASVRNNADAMGLHKASVPALADVDRRFLIQVANGISDYEASLKDGRLLPPRKRGMYFRDNPRYAAFALWTTTFEESLNHGFLKRPGVVAEMLADWKFDPAKATTFWGYVLNESHPDPEHDTRDLVRTFKNYESTKRYTNAHYRKKAASAWKHFLAELTYAPKLFAGDQQATA